MDLSFIIAYAVLGCIAGFAAGLLGIGGGMILVPILTFLLGLQGLPPELLIHAAIATSMASILFTSLSSVWAHQKKGAVRWDLVGGLTPGIVMGGLLAGGAVFAVLRTGWLALFFAAFVGYSALQMFFNRKPTPSRQMPGMAGKTAAGGSIGFVSGLVGAGGGFLSVPFMVWCNVPLHQAVATSAALGFPIALANTAGYVLSGWSIADLPPGMVGYIYWPALLVLVIFSVVTAPLGAKLAHKLPVNVLKRVFAYLLLGLAAYMFYKAAGSFGWIS